MKIRGLLLAVMIALPAPALAQAASDAAAKIDALIGNTKPDAPGCAIEVSQDGKPAYQKAFGLADLEHDVAITPATMFEIGSVSKQFAAAAVLLLAQDGKLKLSDDIRKYLPEMPVYSAPVTVEMLLNHTSGLRDWGSVANAMGKPRGERVFSNAEVLDIVARQKALNYKPGAEYSYTNTGYNLAAIIVERVSGQSFMAFTQERLFDPLGMTTAQWRDDFNRIVKNRAMAYEALPVSGFKQSMPFMNVYGNGGLMMTIADFTRWNEAMMADRLGLRAEMEKRSVLTSGRTIPYARGVSVYPQEDYTEVSHSGSTGGYNAWLARYPEKKLSVAMLCNTPPPNFSVLVNGMASAFLGEKPEPTSVAGLPDPAAYAGQFVNTKTGMVATLTSGGGELRQSARALVRTSAASWLRGKDIYTFSSPDRFTVEGSDGNRFDYVRTPPVTPTAAQLKEYAGTYASDEAMARYTVSVDGGKLKIATRGWPDGDATVAPAYKDAFTTGGFLVRFRRGADGRINAMSLADNRMRDLRAKRVK